MVPAKRPATPTDPVIIPYAIRADIETLPGAITSSVPTRPDRAGTKSQIPEIKNPGVVRRRGRSAPTGCRSAEVLIAATPATIPVRGVWHECWRNMAGNFGGKTASMAAASTDATAECLNRQPVKVVRAAHGRARNETVSAAATGRQRWVGDDYRASGRV